MRAPCPVGLDKPTMTEGKFLDRARKADANLLLQHKGAKYQVIYRRVEQRKNRTRSSREGQGATFPRSQYQEATARSSKRPLASWHWLIN